MRKLAFAALLLAACSYGIEGNLFPGDGDGTGDGGLLPGLLDDDGNSSGDGGSNGGGNPDGEVPVPRNIPGNAPGHCFDFEKNADETDIDCGGAECPTCGANATCSANGDCYSQVCTSGRCVDMSFTDGVKNGVESDVDCGGQFYAPKCADGRACHKNDDCQSKSCVEKICAAVSAVDSIRNGTESDVDCGGADAETPRCDRGKNCLICLNEDCSNNFDDNCAGTDVCVVEWQIPNNFEAYSFVCAPNTARDGALNNGETDIDCGGPAANPRCPTSRVCTQGSDCFSKRCVSGSCQPPTGLDGLHNGDETDIDCGGSGATGAGPCALGKQCKLTRDCASGVCSPEGICTADASCTQVAGGETCGAEGTPESCCAEAELPGGIMADKYLITAGRMRRMLEQLDGNVHSFVSARPPTWWNGEWTNYLPFTRFQAETQLGPWGYGEGCHLRYGGARTYDTDSDFKYGNGSIDRSVLPRDVLDQKALNCVPLPLAAALCAFDGKRLMTHQALMAARGAGGQYPWGNEAPSPARINHDFGQGPVYTFPAGATELSAHVSAPGRLSQGNTANGHADVLGNLMPWIQHPNPDLRLAVSHAWTIDDGDGTASQYVWQQSYVIGARCMR